MARRKDPPVETQAEVGKRHRPDELPPNHHGKPGSAAGERHAAGEPGGGSAVGGLRGTNVGNADPENADIAAAQGSSEFDVELEADQEDAYAGHAGGAVGGTPANKRAEGGMVTGNIEPPETSAGESTIGRNPKAK